MWLIHRGKVRIRSGVNKTQTDGKNHEVTRTNLRTNEKTSRNNNKDRRTEKQDWCGETDTDLNTQRREDLQETGATNEAETAGKVTKTGSGMQNMTHEHKSTKLKQKHPNQKPQNHHN